MQVAAAEVRHSDALWDISDAGRKAVTPQRLAGFGWAGSRGDAGGRNIELKGVPPSPKDGDKGGAPVATFYELREDSLREIDHRITHPRVDNYLYAMLPP